MLLHHAEDTRFKRGYNRYANSRHYSDFDYAPTVIESEGETDA